MDFGIGGEVDEVEQRGHILVVVAVGVPLGKADACPQADPVEDFPARLLLVLPAGESGVWEYGIGKQLPGEVFVGMEHDLVVFGPEEHQVMAGLVHPVFEVEERLFDICHAFRRYPVRVLIPQA